MNGTRHWLTLLLALIAILLIGWNLANNTHSPPPKKKTVSMPTYTSANSDTVVYNPQGSLSYRLVSAQVAWYENESVSWFDNPVMTTYDDNKTPTWSIRADKARLTKDRMLYLYGHVQVTSLTQTSELQRILTDNARVNLVTQDVNSEDRVTLYGHSFTSTGMKMRGNLRTKTAELIEKVKTYYEIHNEPQNP